MTDPFAGPDPAAFARLLCGYCLDAQEGQGVVVRSSTHAAPLLLAMQDELLDRGAFPILRTELPGQAERYWRHVRDAQLDGFSPTDLTEAQGTHASIRIEASGNTRALASVDPAAMARAARARQEIRELELKRRWCVTLWPTPAGAQQAGMSDGEFAAFVRQAVFLDQDDPIAAWRALSERQATLIDRLSQATEIRIEAEGTDLRLRVDGRTWINSDGKRNMPSGEVFTGPHEDSAEGKIRYTIPSSPRGVEVNGIELEFREGRVVSARADQGHEYLLSTLETDPGATLLGELGIGTNVGIDRAIGSILFDEKIAGTVHLALGRSYPETGGTNVSAIHWDMICDLRPGGTLSADGEPIMVDGAFVV
jgi:aminopeptidase